MQMPSQNAAWSHHVRFGRYVGRRLRTAQLPDLTDQVKSATLNLQTLGRGAEDTDFTVQEAMADRDANDDTLDSLAREVRRKLIGRDEKAARSAPYTLIVTDGIGWYTEAPVGEEVTRFQQLRDRVNENLPETDELRTDLVPRLEAAINTYSQSIQALQDASNAGDRARDQLESAISSWRELIDRTYGAVTAQVGRAEAEKFFPKAGGKKAAKTTEEATPA